MTSQTQWPAKADHADEMRNRQRVPPIPQILITGGGFSSCIDCSHTIAGLMRVMHR
jgi:hypothetical protein